MAEYVSMELKPKKNEGKGAERRNEGLETKDKGLIKVGQKGI